MPKHRPRAFISILDNEEKVSEDEIKKGLLNSDLEVKEKYLKILIRYIMNNESYPQLIMNVISGVIPVQEQKKSLKKCLFLYWEIVDKYKENGDIKDEVFLVTNYFSKDLQHANEFIAGRALRLLTQIKSKMVIQPLVHTITTNCLDHIDSYVRRYAVVCLSKIYDEFGDDFLPEIEEKLESMLRRETDPTTKRNAFSLFFKLNKEKAIDYLLEAIVEEEHESFGDILQLVILRELQDEIVSNPKDMGRLLRIIEQFSNSRFNSVLFEVASALIMFHKNPEGIKLAMTILHRLLKDNTDNNVKLLILDLFNEIRKKYPKIVSNDFLNILKVIITGDYELRRRFTVFNKTFITKNNYAECKRILIEENKKVFGNEKVPNNYKSEFVKMVFYFLNEEVISGVEFCTDYLPVFLKSSAVNEESFDTLTTILINLVQGGKKSENFPSLSKVCVDHLLEIKNSRILELAISILGDHIDNETLSYKTLTTIIDAFGELKLDEKKDVKSPTSGNPTPSEVKYITKTVIKADGTYGEERAEVTDQTHAEAQGESRNYNIRENCLSSAVFCGILAKSMARIICNLDLSQGKYKKIIGKGIIIVCQCLRFHQIRGVSDKTLFKRLSAIIRFLTNKKYISNNRYVFKHLLESAEPNLAVLKERIIDRDTDIVDMKREDGFSEQTQPADQFLSFRQMKPKTQSTLQNYDNTVLKLDDQEEEDFVSKLETLVPLSGISDEVYLEAFVKIKKFGTYLEIFIINQTDKIFKNMSISFFPFGDNALDLGIDLDTTSNLVLKPNETLTIHKTLKITPNDASMITANISYEDTSGRMVGNFITDEIQLDLLGTIVPGKITPHEFRALWEAFNWENKVDIKTNIKDPKEFVEYIKTELKMQVIGEIGSFADGKYLTANLYANTAFGHSFLLNFSIEKTDNDVLHGHIRLRCEQRMIVINIFKFIKEIQQGPRGTKKLH